MRHLSAIGHYFSITQPIRTLYASLILHVNNCAPLFKHSNIRTLYYQQRMSVSGKSHVTGRYPVPFQRYNVRILRYPDVRIVKYFYVTLKPTVARYFKDLILQSS